MKVFISWSGESSQVAAITLRDWLPNVIQAIEPYVSSKDIDKGARWNSEISNELAESGFGIICVTPANVTAPWVNFEAGALSKSLDDSHVAPILFGVQRAEVQGPLVQFQSTLAEKEELRALVHTLNKAQGDQALDDGRLDRIFDVWWPRLESALADIPEESTASEATVERPDKEILAEILERVRSQQRVLASPDELLPRDYVEWVLEQARPQRMVPRKHPAWRDLARIWQEIRNWRRAHPSEVPEGLAKQLDRLETPLEYLFIKAGVRADSGAARHIDDPPPG